jgi:hypothetical protein
LIDKLRTLKRFHHTTQRFNYNALLDYHLFDGTFRLTAGAVYNPSRLTATANASTTAINTIGTYEFNGTTYDASKLGSVDANIDFNKIAPYLGLGWGNAVKNEGFGFGVDLGVLFQGSPKTALTNSKCDLPATAIAGAPSCATLVADLAKENIKLADDTSAFKAYPVIRFGLTYKF